MTNLKFRKPYRVRRKKSILKNRFFWAAILILVIVGGIAYVLIFASFFQIKEVQITGNKKIQGEDLENSIWSKIGQRILIFPTKSIFLINFQEIEENILEKFPQISTVNLKRKFPNTLILQTQEREPLFVFCENSDLCFYLDKKGVIFEEISEIEETLLKINDTRSQEVYLGKETIKEDLLNTIKEIKEKLKEIGASMKKLTLSDEKITVQTLQNFEIYFNPKEDISNQIQNLSLIFKEEIPLENRENLEYIDLRFGNRVYYKYKLEK